MIDAFNEGDFPMLKGLTVLGCFVYILASFLADTQLAEGDGVYEREATL